MATAPKAAGIMDLPENEEMDQAPQLSPMESYDAVTTALNIASPDASAQYEQTMNMSLPPELMNMSAEEIGQLLQLFQFLQDNPEEYPAAIAELIKDGIIDEGDLPPEYDDEVLATVSALLMQALKTKQGAMPQQPQGFAMGGIADAARFVANQGRGQDTMLAHITPEEAQLLRSRGGMGTINPMTGLREFGFFKKLFRGVTKVVKAVVKPIVKVAKQIVKSPIGRIVATIALTAFLGPAVGATTGMLGLGAAGTAAVVSGGLTALSGGSLKDALISGATAYFGAPGGPVAEFVGKAGITSIAGQAAAASGLIGTAASLATGKNLKESIRSGLTQAAISGGSAIVSNYRAQADGSKSIMDAINKDAPVLTPEGVMEGAKAPAPVENRSIGSGSGEPAPVMGSGQRLQPAQPPLTEADYRALDPEYFDRVTGATRPTPNMTPNAMGNNNRPVPVFNRNMVSGPGGNVAPVTTAGVMPQAPDISQFEGWGAAYDGPKNLSFPRLEGGAPVTTARGMPTDFNISQYDGYGAAFDGPKNLSFPTRGPAPVTTARGMPTDFNISQYDDWGAAYDGSTSGPAVQAAQVGQTATGPYKVPGMFDSAKKIGSGIMDIGKGNFEQGFKDLTGGAGDLFMPSGPTPEQIQDGKLQAYKTALVRGEQVGLKGDALKNYASEAMKTYTSPGPGIIRTYGPGIAAGLGATALMGGFKQPEMPESELQKKLSGTPGADLIEADPSKYVIGNLPGVQYDERGNIIGSTPYSPPQTLDDIRVSAGTGPGQNMLNAYAPPAYSPTAGGGQSILQPYNQSSMYANLMNTPMQPRYAAQGGMMSGGIANLAGGGYPRRTGQIEGPGTEKSDSIPAMLSDGEFVMTAGAVRGAGNGSRRAGAKKMYALMHQLEQNAARG
jgi:hypothetical protein